MQKYLLLLFPCRNCNSESQQHKLCHRMLLSSDMTTCSALLHCNGPLQKKKDNSSSSFSLSGASIWKKMHNCIFRLQFLTSVLFIFHRWLIICDNFLFIYFFLFLHHQKINYNSEFWTFLNVNMVNNMWNKIINLFFRQNQ